MTTIVYMLLHPIKKLSENTERLIFHFIHVCEFMYSKLYTCTCTCVFSLQLPYIHPLPMAVSTQFFPYPSETSPYFINAHIGTYVDNRYISIMVYRLGLMYLFDEPLNNLPIQRIFLLGPLYVGSFQNPTQDNMVNKILLCVQLQVHNYVHYPVFW